MSLKHAADDNNADPRADKRAKPEAGETKEPELCPHCELDDARADEICPVCQRNVCSMFCGMTTRTICNRRQCRVRLMCYEPRTYVGSLMAANAGRCGDCELMYCAEHKNEGCVCKACGVYLCADFLEVHHEARGEPYCAKCKPYDAARAYSPVAPTDPVDFLAPDAGADDGEVDVPEPTLESTKKGLWVSASAAAAAVRRSVAAMEHAARTEMNVH